MKNHKWFWGLIVFGAGILLLLSALGIGEGFDLFRIIGSVLLFGISVESLIRSRFFLFPIPLALIVYLWRTPLGFAGLNITMLLVAAALLGIGLSIIFHKKSHREIVFKKSGEWKQTEEILSDNEFVTLESNFGEQIKYIHAGNLKQATINSNFAKMVVYFDQCKVSEEGLKINISGNFTEIVLHIPRAWSIENNVSIFAATITGLTEKGIDSLTKAVLSGSINFGEVKIVYI